MKNRNFQRLGRWIRRAQPPRGDLVRALIGGFVASATNVALLVGAIALLVESATRPGLKAVAAVLVVIELFAFVRSPLRYFERMSAHRLGYAAVTHWRQWLVRVVAGMKFSQWRQHATGDLLERALDDTDQLQDLWLRFFIPLVTTILVMGASDVAVMVLPPHGRWWPVVLTLVLVQVAALTALCTTSGRSFALEARLRQARGDYRALLVEAIAVVPELTLLHRLDEITLRTSRAVDALRHAEVQQRRNYRTQDVVVVVASLLAIATLSLRPTTSSVWLTVASMVALATYELLATVRNALRAAVEVSGGGERLDAVDARLDPRSAPWPLDTTLRLEDVSIVEAGRTLLRDVSYSFPPGTKVAIVGESGTGKSTLLRDMAGLDTVEAGRVTIGATTIDQIDEATLRQHLSYLAGEPGLTRGVRGRRVVNGPFDVSRRSPGSRRPRRGARAVHALWQPVAGRTSSSSDSEVHRDGPRSATPR